MYNKLMVLARSQSLVLLADNVHLIALRWFMFQLIIIILFGLHYGWHATIVGFAIGAVMMPLFSSE